MEGKVRAVARAVEQENAVLQHDIVPRRAQRRRGVAVLDIIVLVQPATVEIVFQILSRALDIDVGVDFKLRQEGELRARRAVRHESDISLERAAGKRRFHFPADRNGQRAVRSDGDVQAGKVREGDAQILRRARPGSYLHVHPVGGLSAFKIEERGVFRADRRAAVSRALTETGCTVLALAAENRSLEEVFLALTEKTPEQEAPAEGEGK